MELDFDDSVVRGLHHYVRLVTRALGLNGACSYVQSDDDTLSAYIALDDRFSGFPDHDVALLWEETLGWSAALETHSGEELLAVAYHGQDVLPPPDVVAAWVRGLFQRGLEPGRRRAERPVPADDDTMRQRLTVYLDGGAGLRLAHRADPPLAQAR